MHWNLGRIYLHLKSNTKLTTLPTLCDTGKLEWTCCVMMSPFKGYKLTLRNFPATSREMT